MERLGFYRYIETARPFFCLSSNCISMHAGMAITMFRKILKKNKQKRNAGVPTTRHWTGRLKEITNLYNNITYDDGSRMYSEAHRRIRY